MLRGLRKMANAIPKGTTLADAAVQSFRAAARTAVANSQGVGGCDSSQYSESTADTVINELVTSSFDWQSIAAGWTHPTVKMASAGFQHSGVTVHEQIDPLEFVGTFSYSKSEESGRLWSCGGAGRGDESIVDSLGSCKAAAVAMGLPFVAEVGPSSDRPSGCFWNQPGSVYFNTLLTNDAVTGWGGVASVCKVAQPADRVPDREYCETLCRAWTSSEQNTDGATGCLDFSCGVSQMLTCAQACRARRQGATESTCLAACDSSGSCTIDVATGGSSMSFLTCAANCDVDGDAACHNPSKAGCEYGCTSTSGASGLVIDTKGAVGDAVGDPCALSPSEKDATAKVGPQLVQYDNIDANGVELEFAAMPEFGPLAPGHGASRQGTTYGPELSFGAVLGAALDDGDEGGNRTHLLKIAMGGSSLGDHWRVGGPLYTTLVQEAQAALHSTGSELGGLLWFQGYNDQYSGAYCNQLSYAYEENLRGFIAGIRSSLGAANLPVVVVKARNGGDDMDRIHLAQDAVDSKAANGIPGVSVVASADTSECYHYDSGAQLVIGERAANAMLELLD